MTIRNISRTLSPHDIAGMTGIGTFETRHLHHTVDFPAPTTHPALLDRSLMASKFAGSEHHLSRPAVPTISHQAPPKAYGILEQPPSSPSHSPVAAPYHTSIMPTPTVQRSDRTAGPLAQQPLPPWHDPSRLPKPMQNAPGVKEYCSYWLRHGECDYAQQGCLYRHEMPLDIKVLHRLGLRDLPRWYRELHGVGSFLAVSSGMGSIDIGRVPNDKVGRMDRDWRGVSGNKISQHDVETGRTSLTRVRVGADRRAAFDETGNPVCPPCTPQMGLKHMSSTNSRSRFRGGQCKSQQATESNPHERESHETRRDNAAAPEP